MKIFFLTNSIIYSPTTVILQDLPRGGGWGGLVAELQESGYIAKSAPHVERTHFTGQTGGWAGDT
jgi:hypothetical protein